MSVEVVLDIYSGRKNPAWSLDRQEINELGQQLGRLHKQTNELPQPPALGYRGFRIHAVHEKMPSHITVFDGIVQTESGNFHDRAHEFERWLIRQSRGHVDASTYSYLESLH